MQLLAVRASISGKQILIIFFSIFLLFKFTFNSFYSMCQKESLMLNPIFLEVGITANSVPCEVISELLLEASGSILGICLYRIARFRPNKDTSAPFNLSLLTIFDGKE